MKRTLIIAVVLLSVLSSAGFAGCAGKPPETGKKQVVQVERGDLVVTINADGKLDMPRESKLRFGSPGTVKGIFVKEGDRVREGTLLAKLDDTTPKLAVAAAQYDVELALNELVQKVPPATMGYPQFYPDTNALIRVEQAQDELQKAWKLLGQGGYQDAAAQVRLAQHDLSASYSMLNDPKMASYLEDYDDLGEPFLLYPDIPRAIELLEQDQARLVELQMLIEQGKYEAASVTLSAAQLNLQETHRLVKGVTGRISISQRTDQCCGGFFDTRFGPEGPPPGFVPEYSRTRASGIQTECYPDTSTSLDWLRQALESLNNIQAATEKEGYDQAEVAKLLRLAQIDLDMSQQVMEEDELIFRHGLSLKSNRAFNLNLQKANSALKQAKEQLMNTEILAPFSGTVVAVDVKENDQLSSFDYSSVTAVHLVDTSVVEMQGVVDEIDIYRVHVGQEVFITLDALPDEELKGKVTFISPFGTEMTGVVEFPVTIALEPAKIELKGGLSATADIVVEKRAGVLLVPSRAVAGSSGEYWVEVPVDETGQKVEKRPVVLGAQSRKLTEIVSGLTEGDKVLVE